MQSGKAAVLGVMERSRDICLSLYTEGPFDEEKEATQLLKRNNVALAPLSFAALVRLADSSICIALIATLPVPNPSLTYVASFRLHAAPRLCLFVGLIRWWRMTVSLEYCCCLCHHALAAVAELYVHWFDYLFSLQKGLLAWRDSVARKRDVSPHAVLANACILLLAQRVRSYLKEGIKAPKAVTATAVAACVAGQIHWRQLLSPTPILFIASAARPSPLCPCI